MKQHQLMKRNRDCSARVALITGAGRRIGAVIANHLHQTGYRVAIHCHRSKEDANALCSRLNLQRPDSATVFVADLTKKNDTQSLINDTLDWAGQIDVLVNNASLFKPTYFEEPNDLLWNTMFAINVQAPFWLSLAARASLARQQGSIINITDIHAETALKGYAEYCQTKAALAMQTKALAREFAPDIRVNAIAPGAIAWPEGENKLSDEQQEHIIAKTLLKRHGEAIYIAQATLSLINNPFITGQSLRVDGGRI